ncbi:MAG: hypothetical protein AAF810_27065 [Cyanobacteria bacterium P01_D01_bin.36]
MNAISVHSHPFQGVICLKRHSFSTAGAKPIPLGGSNIRTIDMSHECPVSLVASLRQLRVLLYNA